MNIGKMFTEIKYALALQLFIFMAALLPTGQVWASESHTLVTDENEHTVYSGWEGLTLKVSFEMGDESYDEDGNLLHGEARFIEQPMIFGANNTQVSFIADETSGLYRKAEKYVRYDMLMGEMPPNPVWPDKVDSDGNVLEQHYFIGWFLLPQIAIENNGLRYVQYSSASLIDFTEDVTLYAWWASKKTEYKVRFWLNDYGNPDGARWPDGTNESFKECSGSFYSGDTFEECMIFNDPEFEFNGIIRDFDGWWTEAAGGERIVATDIIGERSEKIIDLYAHWKWGITYEYAFDEEKAIINSNFSVSGGLPKGYADINTGDIVVEDCNYYLYDRVKSVYYHPFEVLSDNVTGVDNTWYCADTRGINQLAQAAYFGEGSVLTLSGNITLYAVLVPERQFITYNRTTGYGRLNANEIFPAKYICGNIKSLNNPNTFVKNNIPTVLEVNETGIKKKGYDFLYWFQDNNPGMIITPGVQVVPGVKSFELFAVWEKHKYILSVTKDSNIEISDLTTATGIDYLLPGQLPYADRNEDYYVTLPVIEDKTFNVKIYINDKDINGNALYSKSHWTDDNCDEEKRADKERNFKISISAKEYRLYKNQIDYKEMQENVLGLNSDKDKNSYLIQNLLMTSALYKAEVPYSFSDILLFLGQDYSNEFSNDFLHSTMTFVPEYNYLGMTTPEAFSEGYRLLGFSKDKTSTNPEYKALEQIEVKSDMILYAVWEPMEYSISFDAQGGRFANAPELYEKLSKDPVFFIKNYNILEREYIKKIMYGEAMPDSVPFIPVKTGYEFKGFFTEPGGEGYKLYDEQGLMIKEEFDTLSDDPFIFAVNTGNDWQYRFVVENFVKKTGTRLPHLKKLYAYWEKTGEYINYPEKLSLEKNVAGGNITGVTKPFTRIMVKDAKGNYEVAESIPSTETLEFKLQYSPYVVGYTVLHNGGDTEDEAMATLVDYCVTVPVIVQSEGADYELSFMTEERQVNLQVPKWVDIYRLSELNIMKLSEVKLSPADDIVFFEETGYDFANENDAFIDLNCVKDTSTEKLYTVNEDEVEATIHLGAGQVDKTSYNDNLVAEGQYADGGYKYFYFIANTNGNTFSFGERYQNAISYNELIELLAYNWALPDVLPNGRVNTVKGINDELRINAMDSLGNSIGTIDLIESIMMKLNTLDLDGINEYYVSCLGDMAEIDDTKLSEITVINKINPQTLNGIYTVQDIVNYSEYKVSGLSQSGLPYSLLELPTNFRVSFNETNVFSPECITVHTPVVVSGNIIIPEENRFDPDDTELIHRENVGEQWEMTQSNTIVLTATENFFEIQLSSFGTHKAITGYGTGDYRTSKSGERLVAADFIVFPFKVTYMDTGQTYNKNELIYLETMTPRFMITDDVGVGDFLVHVYTAAVNADLLRLTGDFLDDFNWLGIHSGFSANLDIDEYLAFDTIEITIIGSINAVSTYAVNNAPVKNYINDLVVINPGNKLDLYIDTLGDFSETENISADCYGVPEYYFLDSMDLSMIETFSKVHLLATRVNNGFTTTFTEAGVDYNDRSIKTFSKDKTFLTSYILPYYLYCVADEDFADFEKLMSLTTLNGHEDIFIRGKPVLVKLTIYVKDIHGNIYRYREPYYAILNI